MAKIKTLMLLQVLFASGFAFVGFFLETIESCSDIDSDALSMEKLIRASRQKKTLQGLLHDHADVPQATSYIETHRDYSAYHLIMALRSQFPDAYAHLSKENRALVLCSALENTEYMNDWGLPNAGQNSDSAVALLETDLQAAIHLEHMLNDESKALLFGSISATASHVYKLRRKDYAYRYISRILGKDPKFHADPSVRDIEIHHLCILLSERRIRLK